MKILDINNFISERVKIKPITNAELDNVQKEILKKEQLSFTKDCITCGTIVMFSDGTLGVYMDGAISYTISVFFGRNKHSKAFYLSVPNATRTDLSALLDSDDFTSDLKFRVNTEIYIIRIYTDPLTIDEIKTLETNEFYSILFDFAKHRNYIERK